MNHWMCKNGHAPTDAVCWQSCTECGACCDRATARPVKCPFCGDLAGWRLYPDGITHYCPCSARNHDRLEPNGHWLEDVVGFLLYTVWMAALGMET